MAVSEITGESPDVPWGDSVGRYVALIVVPDLAFGEFTWPHVVEVFREKQFRGRFSLREDKVDNRRCGTVTRTAFRNERSVAHVDVTDRRRRRRRLGGFS